MYFMGCSLVMQDICLWKSVLQMSSDAWEQVFSEVLKPGR